MKKPQNKKPVYKETVTLKSIGKRQLWQISNASPKEFKESLLAKNSYELYSQLFFYLTDKFKDADEIKIIAKYKTKE